LEKDKLEDLKHTLQHKFNEIFVEWLPSDLKLKEILNPWKKIFDSNYWETFLNQLIIPKLTYHMTKLEINPKNQVINNIK